VATDEAIEQRLREAPEDEDVKERLEREHTELLEELRALIPGAQVLFGFLLAIRFTSPFTDLNAVQRYVYYATLLSTAVALVLLLAPSACASAKATRTRWSARATGRRSPGRAPSPWPSRRAVPHHRPGLHHPSRDRGRGRLLRADRMALVGDRAVPQGPRAGRGQGHLGRRQPTISRP
jgi:hypothetical protein